MQFSKVFSIFIKLPELIPSKLISFKFEHPLKVDFILVTSFIIKFVKLTFINSLLSLKNPSKDLRFFFKKILIFKMPEIFGKYLPLLIDSSLRFLK